MIPVLNIYIHYDVIGTLTVAFEDPKKVIGPARKILVFDFAYITKADSFSN